MYNLIDGEYLGFSELFRLTLKRLTLSRIFQNSYLRQISVHGDIIDLGGESGSQYYSYIDTSKAETFCYADLYKSGDNIINVDFEKPFKLPSRKFDCAIMMNVVEHIYNSENLFNETFRILRPSGRIIGIVPFLYQVHAIPNDFHRYTKQSLNALLENAGFKQIFIKEIGLGRHVASASFIGHKIKLKHIAFIYYLKAILLDKIYTNKNSKIEFPLNYYFQAVRN